MTATSMLPIALALTFLLLTSPSPAEASSLIVWRNMGCSGPSDAYNGCGCFNLTNFGGYEFKYSGQPVKFYCGYGCECPYGAATVKEDQKSCGGIKFDRSIELPCESAE